MSIEKGTIHLALFYFWSKSNLEFEAKNNNLRTSAFGVDNFLETYFLQI